MIVLNKAQGMYKVGAYLAVFHESEDNSIFKWEIRSMKFSKCNMSAKLFSLDWIQSHMRAYHSPFLFVNIAAVILFLAGTYQNYQNIFTLYEGLKILIFLFLAATTFVLIHTQKKITARDYVDSWKVLKILDDLDKIDNV